MSDQLRRSMRTVAVLFGACLLVGTAAAARASTGFGVDPGTGLPGTPPSAAPSVTVTGPAPTDPVPTDPVPSETCAPAPTASVSTEVVPAALHLQQQAKNKGPFKIDVKCSHEFSRKELDVDDRSLYTNCTIQGTIVSSCVIGGMGRYITVQCGKIKGTDVIEVTVDKSGNETKFKVDIQCV